MEPEVLLDDLLRAIQIVRLWLPVGTPAAVCLGLIYEAVVELRDLGETAHPDALREALAKKLGGDVAEILKERFGG